jgi:hypothetical protein
MCYIIKSVVGVALFVGHFEIIHLVVYEIHYCYLNTSSRDCGYDFSVN